MKKQIIKYLKLIIKYSRLFIITFSRPFAVEQIFTNTKLEVNKKTIVVILTCFGHLEYTKQCIESYYASIDNSYNYVLLVLDDQSKDATKDYFLGEGKKLLNLIYVRFKHNKGLTRSWNYGGWFALNKLKADYVFLANNDIIISKDSISRLVSGLKKESVPAIIGPLTNCPGWHKNQNVRKFNPGYKPSDKARDIQITAEKIKNGKVLNWDELNGFFFGGKREVFEKNMYSRLIHPYYFNPSFRDAGNECEFQKRLRDTGMKILLAANTFIFHYKDISLGRFKKAKHKVYRSKRDTVD